MQLLTDNTHYGGLLGGWRGRRRIVGKLGETGVNKASLSLAARLICNGIRIRVSSHRQRGKTTVVEVPKCWAVRSLS